MAKAAAPKGKKPLARMKASDKGSIHHVEIHPAKNSTGGQAFRTLVHRNRPKAHEDAMAKGGPYMPPPEPEETVHEDGEDMMDHVGKSLGVAQPPMDDGDADQD